MKSTLIKELNVVPFCISTQIDVSRFRDGPEAEQAGKSYRGGFIPLKITELVIVQEGTTSGNGTVDVVLVDEQGKKYVSMITTRLLNHSLVFGLSNIPSPGEG